MLKTETQLSGYPESAIAIVGMACKFAGADSVEDFWEVIQSGASLCREVPEERFPTSRVHRRPGITRLLGCMVNDVDAFDHQFFKVSSREATSMDPQQRQILQVTYQAMESAGYFANGASETEHDIGCYLGVCTNEYVDHVACHPPNAFSAIGTLRPFLTGKISHHFGWTGPSITYDTACASAGTAINAACQAIATGECTSAVAGGVNIFNRPETFQDLAAGHFTSQTGACKSFDAAADGYCRGEGAAMVVLKKLTTAVRGRDNIMAVIAATGVSQNANETHITVPHGPSQMALYRKVLRLSGLNAHDIDFVEAHGSGTPVGDPIEANSISTVFGSANRAEILYMGTGKSTIGHTEAVSGVAGLIKTVLMMQHEMIPQQALFERLNPKISPLEPYRVAIPTKNIPWNSMSKAACVNNYGASGSNAVMIVMQPPHVGLPSTTADERSLSSTKYPITVSAFSPQSLASYCLALYQYIEKSTGWNDEVLANVAFCLSRRINPNFSHSLLTTVSSMRELKDVLKSGTAGLSTHLKLPPRPQPVILTFSGQTSNTVSLPKTLYQSSALFRKHLDDCDTTLQAMELQSIYPTIFGSSPVQNLVLLHSMLFSEQYTCAKAWLDSGLQVNSLIGHSFGQLTALCIAGVLSLHDSLKLVAGRARLIQRHWGTDPGSMLAIETDERQLSDIISRLGKPDVGIACYNAPQSHVVAGRTASIDALECLLASTIELSSLKRKRLDVTNAFHSALTEPLLSSMGELAEQLNFRDPLIPLETCSKGHSWQTATPKLVAAHTREPVFFTQAVRRITTQFGPCTWLEAGTGSGMPAMVRRALGPAASSHHIQSLNLGSSDPLDSLARATVDLWKLGHRLQYWSFHSSQRHEYISLNLPPYQFDKPRHWLEWKQLGQQPVESLPLGPTAPTERVLVSLTKKNANGAEFIIDSRSREWQLLVTSYVVLGIPMCPPSLYIEFVTRAAAMLQESPALEGSPALEDMVFHIPLRGDQDQKISLTLESMRVPCSWKFSLDSQATHDSKATHHSSGLISFVEADDRKVKAKFSRYQRLMSIAHTKELLGDLSAESLRGKSVYRSLSGLIQIGELYQGLKAVSAKDAEATGQIVIPPNDIMRDFVTNPVAIDSFVQVASLHFNSLGDRTDNELFVNTALGHVQAATGINISTTESTSWTVYSNSADTGDTEITSDIYVFNPHSSQLSMILLGAKFTKVAISSFRQMLLQGLGEQKQVAISQENKVSAEPIEVFKPEPVRIPTVPKRTPSAESEADTKLDDLPNLDKALYELLSRVADVDTNEISNKTLILDMGMGSLMGIEVLEELNKQFSVNLDMGDFIDLPDIESLCNLIATKTSKFSRANAASTSALSSNSDITRSDSAAQSTGPTSPLETGPGSGEKLDSITIPSLKSAENVIEESQGSRAAQISPSSVRDAFEKI